MTCGIYGIRNKINDKVYIGNSQNIEKRFKNHLCALRNSSHVNDKLQFDYDELGELSFEFEIIKETHQEELDKWESYYANFFDSWTFGYNVTLMLNWYRLDAELEIELDDFISKTVSYIKDSEIGKRYYYSISDISKTIRAEKKKLHMTIKNRFTKYCFESIAINYCATSKMLTIEYD